MTDDCMGCREPGYSHAAYCPESRVEDLRKQLADSERLREDERLTWDAQHKRQASVNAHLAALVTDAQEELRKCQQDAIQLQARLAHAEACLAEKHLRLAEAEALLREWADSGVEYKSSKYRLTQVDHRTYLETVDFLAADSASHRENDV